MRRLAFLAVGFLLLVALAAVGCSGERIPVTDKEIVNSCVSCHSDKELLKQTAAPSPEEEPPEESSGEG